MAAAVGSTMPAEALGPAGVVQVLQLAATEIQRLWAEALDAGDFTQVSRWVDAGQAVHRALVALDDGTTLPPPP